MGGGIVNKRNWKLSDLSVYFYCIIGIIDEETD